MKIRHPIIAIIVILIVYTIGGTLFVESTLGRTIMGILNLLLFICLGIIVYLLLRNLFRAIKGQTSKHTQSGAEADMLRTEVERLSKRVEELEKDR